jgi:hypothetical protein
MNPSEHSPESAAAQQQRTHHGPFRVEVVGNDRVRVEFMIEDLVERLLRPPTPGCSGCKGCSA